MIAIQDAALYGIYLSSVGGRLVNRNGTIEVEGAAEPAAGAVLAYARGHFCALVDAAAEAERGQYITEGAGQAMSYLQKSAQATAYLAALDPVDADYPMLAAEVGVTGETIAEVASVIAAASAAWEATGAQIEGARLAAKKAINAATTLEELRAAVVAAGLPV